ncbi:MAG: hypothetical protein AB8H12_21690 [Lewinella sp.]
MKLAYLLGTALLLVLITSFTSFAATDVGSEAFAVRTITGKVTDAETSEPLIGVNIIVQRHHQRRHN